MSGKCCDTSAVTRSTHRHLVPEKHGRIVTNCAALQVRTARAETSSTPFFEFSTAPEYIQEPIRNDIHSQLSLNLHRCTSPNHVLSTLRHYTSGKVQGVEPSEQQHTSQLWDDTAELLQGLNASELAAVWKKLEQVVRHPRDKDALRTLLKCMEERSLACMKAELWTHSHAVTALHAMAQLDYTPSNSWQSEFEKYSLLKLSPRQLSNALWACASLELLPSHSWLETAIQQSLHHAEKQQLTAAGCAVLLWSVSRLAVSADTPSAASTVLTQQQLSQLLLHCSEQLPFMQPRHISMQLWALGHLASNCHASMQAHLTQQGSTQQRPTDNQQQSITDSRDASLQDFDECVNRLWEGARRCGAEGLGPQGTANTLWAAANLGIKFTPASNTHPGGGSNIAVTAVQQLLVTSESQLQHMTAQQQYNVAWAAATMQATVSPSWAHALLISSEALLKPSHRQLARYQPQSLAGLLWTFPKLGFKPGREWMTSAMREVQSWNGRWCEHTFPLFLWSLSTLGFCPGRFWAKNLTQKEETIDLLSRMEPRELAMCVHALARLELPPHPSWNQRLLSQLHVTIQRTLAAVSQNQGSADSSSKQKQNSRHVSQTIAGASARKQATSPSILPQELSACLQGIAKLGIQPSSELLEDVDKLVCVWLGASHMPAAKDTNHQQRAVARIGTRQLSGILYGLVRISRQATEHLRDSASNSHAYQTSEQLLDIAVSTLISQCYSQLQIHDYSHADNQQTQSNPERSRLRMLAVDVAQGCWAVAMLGHTPSKGHLQDLSHITRQLLPYMTHVELSQCVWAIQRLGLSSPDYHWISTMLVIAKQELENVRNMQTYASGNSSISEVLPETTASNGTPLLSATTLLVALEAWCTKPSFSKLLLSSTNRPVLTGLLKAAQTVIDFEVANQARGQQSEDIPTNTQQSKLQQQHQHHNHQQQQQKAGGMISPDVDNNNSNAGNSNPNSSILTPLHINHDVTIRRPSPDGLRQLNIQREKQPHTDQDTSSTGQPMSLPESMGNRLQLSGPTPYVQAQSRTAWLSASEVTTRKKEARRQLWRGHRQRQLLHNKAMQASKGSLARLKSLVANAGSGSPAGLEHDSEVSSNQGPVHDDPYTDHDLRYIPWCFVIGAVFGDVWGMGLTGF